MGGVHCDFAVGVRSSHSGGRARRRAGAHTAGVFPHKLTCRGAEGLPRTRPCVFKVRRSRAPIGFLMKIFAITSLVCMALACVCSAPTARAAEQPAQVYDQKDVDEQPTPKRRIKMGFPRSTREDGAIPSITLRFVVTKEGTVEDIVIVKFTHPDLIEEAMDAYERARFNPGVKDGEPVHTRLEVTETWGK